VAIWVVASLNQRWFFLIWENGLAALSFTLATDDLLGKTLN
jgi:hypothetical protein